MYCPPYKGQLDEFMASAVFGDLAACLIGGPCHSCKRFKIWSAGKMIFSESDGGTDGHLAEVLLIVNPMKHNPISKNIR
jgi:hypothetical protein